MTRHYKLHIFYLLAILLVTNNCLSQKGKDGPATIAAQGVIFNRYTALTQSAAAGNTFIVISNPFDLAGSAIPGVQNNPYSTDGLEGCDLMMIIKMQGASINTSNSSAYGTITNYNGVGDYEII